MDAFNFFLVVVAIRRLLGVFFPAKHPRLAIKITQTNINLISWALNTQRSFLNKLEGKLGLSKWFTALRSGAGGRNGVPSILH